MIYLLISPGILFCLWVYPGGLFGFLYEEPCLLLDRRLSRKLSSDIMDFRRKCIRTITYVGNFGPHSYVSTELGEDNLIGSRDMLLKRSSKWRFHLLLHSVPILYTSSVGNLYMCHRTKFQQNRSTQGWIIAIRPIFPLLHLWSHFALMYHTVSSTGFVSCDTPKFVLDIFAS